MIKLSSTSSQGAGVGTEGGGRGGEGGKGGWQTSRETETKRRLAEVTFIVLFSQLTVFSSYLFLVHNL